MANFSKKMNMKKFGAALTLDRQQELEVENHITLVYRELTSKGWVIDPDKTMTVFTEAQYAAAINSGFVEMPEEEPKTKSKKK